MNWFANWLNRHMEVLAAIIIGKGLKNLLRYTHWVFTFGNPIGQHPLYRGNNGSFYFFLVANWPWAWESSGMLVHNFTTTERKRIGRLDDSVFEIWHYECQRIKTETYLVADYASKLKGTTIYRNIKLSDKHRLVFCLSAPSTLSVPQFMSLSRPARLNTKLRGSLATCLLNNGAYWKVFYSVTEL